MYLSVISPVYNEHDNIPLLYEAVSDALRNIEDWEFILVDDGSSDGSLEELKKIAEKDPQRVKIVALRRNFGQTAAIAAGVDHASGEVIVLMDADLQNDPADIPMMLNKINEGYDLVSGWRKNRHDNLSRTLPSKIANKIIGKITGVDLHDYGCTLKAYRREVITGFRLYGEMHRFIPAFANTVGARIFEVEVNHHARKFGKPKYGLERTVKVILDLFTVKYLSSYANKPIYIFGGVGMTFSVLGGLILFFLAFRRIFWKVSVVASPWFNIGIMVFILGFQLVMMGLLAEVLARAYYESQNKKTYTVRSLINFSADTDLKKEQ